MKAFCIVLLISFCGLISASPPQSNFERSEFLSKKEFFIIDRDRPSKQEVIHDLLLLQRSLLISSQEALSEERAKTGFLLVSMTPEYVSHLLEQKGGRIICTYLDKTLVGYALLTDLSEFKELYQDEGTGRFETLIDLTTLDAWLADPAVGYIEQIAVKPGYSRMGIGSELIAISKVLYPQGLVADVFIDPLKNEASLSFFSHQGFLRSGLLYQDPPAHANFPYPHRTQVFFWNLKETRVF